MHYLAPNTWLRERFKVLEPIGEGGFGVVYRAYDSLTGQVVAVKQLTQSSPEQVQIFEREAKLLARLTHPNLPRVTDYFAERDTWFLVMDFVPGDDLIEQLNRYNAPLPPATVLGWADQVLAALEYLHSHQPEPVIHRDIKPEHLKLTPDGRVMLLDFGIARGPLATRGIPSQRAATPYYAPPEQYSGGADPRSDLYALAATLYYLLTDTLPAAAERRSEMIREGKPDPLAPPHASNPSLPPALGAVLLRAMAFDPDARYGSARELRQALRQVASQPGIALQPEPDSPPLPWYRRIGFLTGAQRPTTQPEPPPAPRRQERPVAAVVTRMPPTPPPINPPAISPATAAQVRELQGLGKGGITAGALAPDGCQLAIATGIGIYLYDAQTLDELRFIDAGSIQSVAFAPDGQTLASGSLDTTVKLWRVSDGALLYIFTGHTRSVSSVAFTPDGRTIVSASADNTVRLWGVETH